MRKVKYSVASSLDGFIARPDGSVDWLFTDGDYGMSEFFKSIDAALLGRKTYEFAISHGPKPKKSRNSQKKSRFGLKSYLFSRTTKPMPGEDVELVNENAGEFVRRLKSESGKDIWLLGGGELARSLLAEGVVDEIALAVHPVLLGSGIPLFPEIGKQIKLELMESKPHSNGLVRLVYSVKN